MGLSWTSVVARHDGAAPLSEETFDDVDHQSENEDADSAEDAGNTRVSEALVDGRLTRGDQRDPEEEDAHEKEEHERDSREAFAVVFAL